MLPTIFEFRWDAGHIIFFGAFYTVVTVALTGLLYVAFKSLIDTYRNTITGGDPIDESEPPIESDVLEEKDEPSQEAAAGT